jgi:hypothetical protein
MIVLISRTHSAIACRQPSAPVAVYSPRFFSHRCAKCESILERWSIRTRGSFGTSKFLSRSDCGGFTAMKHYGGYRWTIWDYVRLTTELRPLTRQITRN